MTRKFKMTPIAQQALWSKLSNEVVFIPTQFLVEGDAKEGYNISYVDSDLCGFSLLPSYKCVRSFYAVKRIVEDINTHGKTTNWNNVLDMRSFAWVNTPMPS